MIAIIGGDERERDLILCLLRAGYRVCVSGRVLSPAEETAGATSVVAHEAMQCPVVIGPLGGIRPDGRTVSRPPHDGLCLGPQLIANCPPGQIWLCGDIRGAAGRWLTDRQVQHVNLAEDDELATLNSIPSAEGALMLAMQESPLVLAGAGSVVLGYGRCGLVLAGMLRGIGSRVTVVARSPGARARATAAGHDAAEFADLAGLLARAEFCFNTIPAMVVPREAIECAAADLTIIDLASAPGGVDFAAARELGIKAVLAPGLPGLVAPRTAGRYLAETILRILRERGI